MAKKKRRGMFFYTVGTAVLIIVGVITVLNFLKDARILKQPILTVFNETGNNTVQDSSTKEDEDYATLKYSRDDNSNDSKAGADKSKQSDSVKSTDKKEAVPDKNPKAGTMTEGDNTDKSVPDNP